MNVKNNRYYLFLKVNNCFTLFFQIIYLKRDIQLNKFLVEIIINQTQLGGIPNFDKNKFLYLFL